jgi:large subunit ribosomal protein L10Ae
MSKINSDYLKRAINEMLVARKQRKFVETVELQVGLRDYDPDKRFNGSIRLPNIVNNKIRVFILFYLGLRHGQCRSHLRSSCWFHPLH